MTSLVNLDEHLATWAGTDPARQGIASAVAAIAAGGVTLSGLIADGPLAGELSAERGENADGDAQKELDVRSNDIIVENLKATPVAYVGSEEADEPIILDPNGTVVVTMDPLDGSSNIDTNVSIGTIFAIYPTLPGADSTPLDNLLQPGINQRAAGLIVYGPQTALILSLGEGTDVFTLDRTRSQFIRTGTHIKIPEGKREYAINASNYRFWEEPIRAYIDDLIAGEEGPRESNFNMRWIASLVAEVSRIVARGGIFLYPADTRKGYQRGRLRLVYEANPVAFVIEQAGGMATDGTRRILDIQPKDLHERTPLMFGAAKKVERVIRYHTEPHGMAERSPLFGKRGLLRN